MYFIRLIIMNHKGKRINKLKNLSKQFKIWKENNRKLLMNLRWKFKIWKMSIKKS